MAFWDGSLEPAMRKWLWEMKRVYNPFVRCCRNGKRLFLKKAYYGKFYLDWEYDHDSWLSVEEYTWAKLRGDFQD